MSCARMPMRCDRRHACQCHTLENKQWSVASLSLTLPVSVYKQQAQVQPGAVKLVLSRSWVHLNFMHVTSENQFHCTRMYFLENINVEKVSK